MGLRFRKSFKVAPGLRMNVGLRGLSMSVGPRGASVNAGPRGLHANVGLPGTGLSVRGRLGGSARGRTAALDLNGLPVAFRLQDDGTVDIVGEDGGDLPPRAVKLAREQHGERLRGWLEEKCEHWNKGIEALLGIHLATPRPDRMPADAACRPFAEPMPTRTPPRRITLLAWILKSKRMQIENQNAEDERRFKTELAAWTTKRDTHDRAEVERVKMFEVDSPLTPDQVQDYLSEVLARIEWPRTTVSLEVDDSATRVMIDVDLPEIEDMPEQSATVAARGIKLNIRDRSAAQRRKEYMTHVHEVLFRIVGEAFAAMPRVVQVVASGFSQRAARATGQVADEYLLSVRVRRDQWMALNFANLSLLDVTEALGNWEIMRDMTATGVFRPIEPFSGFQTGA